MWIVLTEPFLLWAFACGMFRTKLVKWNVLTSAMIFDKLCCWPLNFCSPRSLFVTGLLYLWHFAIWNSCVILLSPKMLVDTELFHFDYLSIPLWYQNIIMDLKKNNYPHTFLSNRGLLSCNQLHTLLIIRIFRVHQKKWKLMMT